MIRAALYVLIGAVIWAGALLAVAALLATGVPLDTATTVASTVAAGISGGLVAWDLLSQWNRGGAL